MTFKSAFVDRDFSHGRSFSNVQQFSCTTTVSGYFQMITAVEKEHGIAGSNRRIGRMMFVQYRDTDITLEGSPLLPGFENLARDIGNAVAELIDVDYPPLNSLISEIGCQSEYRTIMRQSLLSRNVSMVVLNCDMVSTRRSQSNN